MSWTCPNCKRVFRMTDQWHSCAVSQIGDHLKNKPEGIVELFDKIYDFVDQLGEVQFVPVKSLISVKSTANFLSIKVRKQYIELMIQLTREVEEFPIIKTQRASTRRVIHFIVLEEADDFSEQVKIWLKESYDLVTK